MYLDTAEKIYFYKAVDRYLDNDYKDVVIEDDKVKFKMGSLVDNSTPLDKFSMSEDEIRKMIDKVKREQLYPINGHPITTDFKPRKF